MVVSRRATKWYNKKRSESTKDSDLFSLYSNRLLLIPCVALHELINTTCGVNKFHLTGVEGVRSVRNLHFVNGILNTVNYQSLFGVHCRAAEKYVIVGHILECNDTIVFRMDIFFHLFVCLLKSYSATTEK